jgi:predicted DNA-binding transcriptional regulator AlpA
MSQLKPSASKNKFNDLPDEAYIQIRKLIEFEVVPFSVTTIWRKCRSNEFPKPHKVSKGITAWRVGDIRSYLLGISSPKADRTQRSNKSC